MQLRIANRGSRIAVYGALPVLMAALSATVMAQTKPADTQPTSSTAPSTQPAAPNVPVTFGRSGQKVSIAIAPINLTSMELTLRAYGRTWTTAIAQNQKAAFLVTFEVPQVRVPTVFSITPVGSPDIELGQLVAYPDRNIEWDKKTLLIAIGAPQWFEQWGKAVGLPMQWSDGKTPATLPALRPDERCLLVVGPSASEKTYAEFAAKPWRPAFNILVLDADWFADAAGPVSIVPKQMLGDMSEIAKQHWAQPLKFASHRKPWPGIANRWAWIADESGLPLVEEIRPLSAYELRMLPAGEPQHFEKEPRSEAIPRVLLSYVPWQEQIGRSESADASLLAVLRAEATAKPRQCQWHPIWFVSGVWPTVKDCPCPILLAVRSGGFWKGQGSPDAKPSYVEPIYNILDLRGQQKGPATGTKSPSQYYREMLVSAAVSTLLILGDDKMLDEWEWLKLDRVKKTTNRPDVVWLSDDELPPSKDNQIRLMLKLTELGVPLAMPETENGEKRK